MPFAIRARTRPLPRRPKPRGVRRSVSVVPRGTGQTLAQQLGGWASVPLVYIAFDGPNTANPAWVDVTTLVDAAKGIVIAPGRADGLSDANAATCSLTVDDSDGRWIAGNPSGAWNGLVRKGMWIRVDLLPLSGTVSRRFTGYITALPTTRSGKGSETTITASDRYFQLGKAPKLGSMIFEDWTSDPVGAPVIAGYFPLHEPAGATYATDISGQAPPGAQALAVRSHAVSAGSGITWAGAPAPGFDQESTARFTPSGTPLPAIAGGTTGALPNGSYLQGTITLASCAHITCWIQTTTAAQPLWSWTNPAGNFAFGLDIDAQGYLQLWQAPLSGSNFSYSGNYVDGPRFQNSSTSPINDGLWHQIGFRLLLGSTTPNGLPYLGLILDGSWVFGAYGGTNPASSISPSPNMSRFTIGAAEGWNGDVATSGMAFFTGSVSDLVVHLFSDPTIHPNWATPWTGSATGHAGESTGQRLTRLASYAGLPVPLAAFALPGNGTTAYQPAPGTSTAISTGPTAHPCGPQTTLGKAPLDALRTVAHTELMPLYADPYGRLTLQASTLRQNAPAALTVTMSELDPATSFPDDFQYTFNQVSVTPAGQGSVTVNVNGAASQALNGTISTPVDSVSLNPAEAVSLGAAMILAGANPPPRVNLALEAATCAQVPGYGAAWYDTVLRLAPSSVIAVTGWDAETPYGAGGSSTHVLEGWTETISRGNHLFVWATSAPQGPNIQLDSALGTDTAGVTLAY